MGLGIRSEVDPALLEHPGNKGDNAQMALLSPMRFSYSGQLPPSAASTALG